MQKKERGMAMACIIRISSLGPNRNETIFLQSKEDYSTESFKIETNDDETKIDFLAELNYGDLISNGNAFGVRAEKTHTLNNQTTKGFFQTTDCKWFKFFHLTQHELESFLKFRRNNQE